MCFQQSICSDHVKSPAGENLGRIEDLMIDLHSGRIAYAVLPLAAFSTQGRIRREDIRQQRTCMIVHSYPLGLRAQL
jgi:hypothetical protein